MAIADPTQPQQPTNPSTQPVAKPQTPTATNPSTQQPTLPVAASPQAGQQLAGAQTAATAPSAGQQLAGALPVAGGIQPAQTSDPLAFTPVSNGPSVGNTLAQTLGATQGTGDAAPFTPANASAAIANAAYTPGSNGLSSFTNQQTAPGVITSGVTKTDALPTQDMTSSTPYNSQAYGDQARRQEIANMTPEQRAAALKALQDKYAGQIATTQYAGGNTGTSTNLDDLAKGQDLYDAKYLEMLQGAAPGMLPYLTSSGYVNGTPIAGGLDAFQQAVDAAAGGQGQGTQIGSGNQAIADAQANAAAAPFSTIQNGFSQDANGKYDGGYSALADLYKQQGTTPGVVDPKIAAMVKANPALINTLPPDQAQTLARTLITTGAMTAGQLGTVTGYTAPSAPSSTPATPAYGQGGPIAAPAGSTPSTTSGQTVPGVGASQGFTNGNPTTSSPTPGASGTSTNSVSTAPTLTPLTPDNALTNSIISPASNVNRFDVANQQLKDTIANTLEPQFNADLRTADAHDFGLGRGVSGMHRNSIGNLETQHERDINQLTSNFLNPALTGTIQDALNNANFAAGQQQFEAGQQGQAFGQNYALQQLADSENQQQFSQALQKLLAGSQGDPAQIQLLLAELFGGQGAQSTAAATNLAKSAVG